MLNSDFHEGHRRPPRLRQSAFGLMRLRSVQFCHGANSLRTCIQPCPPHVLLDMSHTDLWWNASPLGKLADIPDVERYLRSIPLPEKRYAQCETGKALLFV
jgi:hypothetical protein